MFGIDTTILAIIALAGLSAGAVAYAFLFNRIETERQSGRRLENVKKAETDRTVVQAARDRNQEAARRKKNIQDTIKDLESRQKSASTIIKRPPLKVQIKQAGMDITVQRFYMFSVGAGFVAVLFALLSGMTPAPLFTLPGIFVITAFGLPRWFVGFRRGRRVKAFLIEFPNALDVIVRAVKSGLPLNDGIRLIATEAQEPVKTEFRRIVEAQQLGMSVPEAALRMPQTMPCPEAAFFGVVIQIQQQTGGNLSEALGNLSRVLRDRKKMKDRVQALAMEAKASAMIIGALPFIVAFLVYLTSPNYIKPLFTTSQGHMLLAGAGVWMSIGIFMMKKMMDFEV
ncbi:MAG: type II secretion system F family protein [Zhengella sp.]|uniref:type II secretion system F family protein n=1 Tax=Zhengella sp. TaxID=2282762 RepID=UPI001D798FB7|nr:type II secretion system F family protein [Notoacmeibacter sp.]MCC0025602.1 type II secretion system F family protein [Brucellaceae bacterium]